MISDSFVTLIPRWWGDDDDLRDESKVSASSKCFLFKMLKSLRTFELIFCILRQQNVYKRVVAVAPWEWRNVREMLKENLVSYLILYPATVSCSEVSFEAYYFQNRLNVSWEHLKGFGVIFIVKKKIITIRLYSHFSQRPLLFGNRVVARSKTTFFRRFTLVYMFTDLCSLSYLQCS